MDTGTINFLRMNNTYMTIWWGLAFPGFGQWFQGRYFYGFILIVWEFFINVRSHLNQAIFLSMVGKFAAAEAAIDQKWFLLYISIYVYCIWDCYHVGIELNRFSLLAGRERQKFKTFELSSSSIEFLAQRDPRLGACWSLLLPGAGHFLLHRKLLAIFFIICWTVTMYYSHIPQGVIASMLGDFRTPLRIVDPQWLMFVPSLYLFACYDSYASTYRLNELYREEMDIYLRQRWKPVEGRVSMPNGQSPLTT